MATLQCHLQVFLFLFFVVRLCFNIYYKWVNLPVHPKSWSVPNLEIDSWTKAVTMFTSTMPGMRVILTQAIFVRRVLVQQYRFNNDDNEHTRFRKKPQYGSRFLTNTRDCFQFNAWYWSCYIRNQSNRTFLSSQGQRRMGWSAREQGQI